MAWNMVSLARKANDFIIDQVLQPGADKAERWLGSQVFTLARLCIAIDVMIGLFLDKIVRQALFLRFFRGPALPQHHGRRRLCAD